MRVSNLTMSELYSFVDDSGLDFLMTARDFIYHYGDLPCTPDDNFPDAIIYIEEGFLF